MVVKLPLSTSYTPTPQCFETMARSSMPLDTITRPLARGEQPSAEETARAAAQKRNAASSSKGASSSSSKGPIAIGPSKTTKKQKKVEKVVNKEYNLLPSHM